jgi:acetolactate synthase-1/2/3 large subunit
MLVPHENIAIGMAYGFAMVTGRMQAVMVHVGVGTANAICGLFNASRQAIPIFMTAGRTPWTEGGVLGGRNNYINWAQEMFDQAGMLREATKWDYELKHPAHLESVVDRAMALARSEPQGPIYLVLPREVLAADHPQDCASSSTLAPTIAANPPPEVMAQIAQLLQSAKRPVLITADAGRHRKAWDALALFAERHAVPVVQYRPRFASISTSHPMHAGYDPNPFLREADLVLVADCDVPWIPEFVQPREDAKVVQFGADPLFTNYPLRGFRSNISLAAGTTATLEALAALPPSEQLGTRREWADKLRLRPEPAPTAEQGMSSAWVSWCIGQAADDDTVVLNEYSLVLEQLQLTRHGNYFSHSPAGGLGWATGAALGVRLARPTAAVIVCVGDGTYMFGNPTPFHFVSRAQQLPVLTVVFNNRRWGAVHRATLSMYPDGGASRMKEPPFSTLEPSPDYEKIVEACGGYGEKVEDPAQLPAALARALHAVRVEGLPAVLNVITEINYSRTS